MAVARTWWELPLVTLAPPPKNWEEAILISAREFMNAKVCFYTTKNEKDPITNMGSVVTTVLWSGKARVQHIRAPRDSSNEYQTNDSRSFRFQLDPEDNPPFVYSGMKARVLDAGESGDPILETFAYVADSGVNSSHMAVKTIELTADMKPVTWTWSA